jgi:hypothetical protein
MQVGISVIILLNMLQALRTVQRQVGTSEEDGARTGIRNSGTVAGHRHRRTFSEVIFLLSLICFDLFNSRVL